MKMNAYTAGGCITRCGSSAADVDYMAREAAL
jgi:hypothetical protein